MKCKLKKAMVICLCTIMLGCTLFVPSFAQDTLPATGLIWDDWDSLTGHDFDDYFNVPIPLSKAEIDEYLSTWEGTLKLVQGKQPSVLLDISSYRVGDVNGDQVLSAADARLCLRAGVGLDNLTAREKHAADINGDGELTSGDARGILRAAVGLDDSPVGTYTATVDRGVIIGPLIAMPTQFLYYWQCKSAPEGCRVSFCSYDPNPLVIGHPFIPYIIIEGEAGEYDLEFEYAQIKEPFDIRDAFTVHVVITEE